MVCTLLQRRRLPTFIEEYSYLYPLMIFMPAAGGCTADLEHQILRLRFRLLVVPLYSAP